MKESDYITATYLAKLRTAEHVLRDVVPGCGEGIDEDEYINVLQTIAKWRERLERIVDDEHEPES